MLAPDIASHPRSLCARSIKKIRTDAITLSATAPATSIHGANKTAKGTNKTMVGNVTQNLGRSPKGGSFISNIPYCMVTMFNSPLGRVK